ncbi:UDP-3-O-(3-hydroxymyristoyl)glucosamine N-acyltransferase [Aliidiomarina haloalkalitolerans]|uniref:UDP-3-O-acylglucosamine N-acyltransferase n=2 Tax=Aliidiomarina haloalkalitolerans TaxID=859059 RepID=A0A432VXX4_9GAMM|nr:UDP-3-O-(3-hydroxymyristoyl)glucosamine N-acyltransferase [Aliidiomarina haloalkalitolerans]RUO21529.1 UDP-3-O-(3-hydroxymyristoyl)glucosamine N-acyltransferase [Aliidiomarina haloalkalitolerans]
MTLSELAERIGATVRGDGALNVSGLATLANAGPHEVGFLANEKYQSQLQSTQAGAVILRPEHDDAQVVKNALISDNPYLAYAYAAQAFDKAPQQAVEVHPSAVIDPTAKIGEHVAVGPQVVIEAGAVIGDHAVIGAQCYVGHGAEIGAQTRLWPGVKVYYGVRIGERCTLHAGAVVGADGFGWASDRGKWVKIPQLGAVVIGDDVEIGANTTIDRGALDDTVIGSNCIIDNLVMVAHNVQIGDGTAIAGQTGIAGSAKIGKHCLIGGASGINGHITIADGVQVHGMTMVTKNLERGVYASSLPVVDQTTWAKSGARVRQLPELFMRVRALEKKLENPEG